MSDISVRDIEAALARAFPPEWAEPWDRVGLFAGDPDATVVGVLVTLDATLQSVHAAAAVGANVVVSHHPVTLDAPAPLTTATPEGRVLLEALGMGISLVNAHTNLDRSPDGAVQLTRMLGLPDGEPLESGTLEEHLVTVYVPPGAADAVAAAMHAAGAGRIGLYEGCRFTSQGHGSFRPLEGATPLIGEISHDSTAEEHRIEMVCPEGRVPAVMRAARGAHPYDEPLIHSSAVKVSRGAARMGRLSALSAATDLREFATGVGRAFDCAPRVWGEPASSVSSVAVMTGSGGSLIPAALGRKADVFVVGEVRYHDALEAVASGMTIVEIGHDVSEWPLVPVLAEAVRSAPGIDAAIVHVEEARRAWWTAEGDSDG